MRLNKREIHDLLKKKKGEFSGSPRRSPVFDFFMENYESIMLEIGSPIRWKTMCEWLNELGITNANGEPPKESHVRQIWYAVRKKVQKQREAEAEEATLKEQKAQERREARKREKQEEREGLRRFNLLVERQKEKKPHRPHNLR